MELLIVYSAGLRGGSAEDAAAYGPFCIFKIIHNSVIFYKPLMFVL